jgi:hypothetical protein
VKSTVGDNGILAYVGGQFISQASDQLPPPGPAAPPEGKGVIEVPDLGQVRITYRLNTYKRGKSRHYHWLAIHAEKVERLNSAAPA